MLKAVSKRPDPILLFTIIGLLLFGILMVYDASIVYAHEVFGGKYHFLLKQLFWVLFGSFAGGFFFFVDLKRLRSLATPLFIATLFLLLFLVIPRFLSFSLYDRFVPEVNGARRWIVLNPPGILPTVPLLSRLSFQPSELAKLSLVLYLSTWFSPKRVGRGKTLKSRGEKIPGILAVGVPLAILGGLVFLEPDFATAALMCLVGTAVYFIAGARILSLVLVGLLVLGLGTGGILISPYRRARLMTFLDPAQADPLSSGYHLRQIMIALGSGGPFGVGVGESRQKYEYLPETIGDSIFAIIGEELGFLGTTLVVFAFLLLLWRGFLVVRDAPSRFSKLLSCGVVVWLTAQVLVNLCAMTALLPLTGIALPLISYGGSSMIFSLAGLGILLNVSSEVKKR